MAHFIADFLSPLGFEIHFEEIEPGRPNLIARAPGPENRPRILLGPHLDTVGIAGMSIAPFSAEIKDGKVHGRGTSDTKGPMAAMLWALKEKAPLLEKLPVAVDFVGFMGEESSQPGSRHFAKKHGTKYQFAIVGEPTSLEAVFCTKGCLWATLRASGKSTHASQPHLGENAILKLIVPELVKNETASSILRRHTGDLEIVQLAESPPMEMPADHPWLQKLQAIDPKLKLTGAPWFSDAAHLSAAGLPSICLGPGSIDQAHTADEFISISDLEDGARWFSAMIAGLAD